MRRTLLAILAHPDDEPLGVGGTLTQYPANGARVVLACATRGEVGEISDPTLATRETLGQMRETEPRPERGEWLRAALSVHELRFLGYRDEQITAAVDVSAQADAK